MRFRIWFDGGERPFDAGAYDTVSLAKDDKGVAHVMADGKKLGQYDPADGVFRTARCWRTSRRQ